MRTAEGLYYSQRKLIDLQGSCIEHRLLYTDAIGRDHNTYSLSLENFVVSLTSHYMHEEDTTYSVFVALHF